MSGMGSGKGSVKSKIRFRSMTMNIISTLLSAWGFLWVPFYVGLFIGLIGLKSFFSSGLFDAPLRLVCRCLVTNFGIMVHRDPKLLKTLGQTQKDSVLFMGNHVNMFDGFLYAGWLKRPIRGLELEGHFSWPIYGLAVRLYGNIPIPHNSPRKARAILESLPGYLEDGQALMILPEGHRTRTGRLSPFMTGPFRVAKKSPCTLIPLAMVGAYERQRVGGLRIKPGKVWLKSADPIPGLQMDEMNERQLKERVFNDIQGLMNHS